MPAPATGSHADAKPIARAGVEAVLNKSQPATASIASNVPMMKRESAFHKCARSVPWRDLRRTIGPAAQNRLSLLSDGRVRYEMKRTWKDRTRALVLDPM